jgi:hypothetical protein
MVNIGTITVAGEKNFITSTVQGQPATLINAAFGAEGTLILTGSDNTFAQDSIAGVVAYIQDDTTLTRIAAQRVQPLTYTKLGFFGTSQKLIQTAQAAQGQTFRNLVCADTLMIGQPADSIRTRVQVASMLELQTRGAVMLYGPIAGIMRLAGARLQSVTGSGSVTWLVADNPANIQINSPAQIRVGSRLDLVRGELQSAANASISLGDSVLITRTVSAALRGDPVFGRAVSVRYTGNGTLTTTGELPTDSTVLQRLECLATGGVTLAKSATVNDSLILAASLRTGTNTLTFRRRATLDNPTFLADTCEIIGSFRRFFTIGSAADTAQRLMNNVYTFIQFPLATQGSGSQGSSGLASVTLRITPDTFPEPNNDPSKIRRGFLFASTGLDAATPASAFVRVGYGWRLRPRNETNGLQPAQILLQRWNSTNAAGAGTWQTTGVPQNPQASWQLGSWNTRTANNFWTIGVTDSIPASQISGFFALGLDADFGVLPATTFNIRAALEGASSQSATGFLQSNALMHNTLQRLSLLPSMLPEQYPFTLLGARRLNITAATFTDSVVDWMVLELRRSLGRGADSVTTYPVLLKQNGLVTSVDGRSLPLFRRSVYDSTRFYYVALHHRNHLPVVTATRIDMTPNQTLHIDFTQPTTPLGGADALKFIGNDNTGNGINALLVGDVNADGSVGRADYDGQGQSVWTTMFSEGYVNTDADMNGVVTTADMNRVWNNRGRTSRLTLKR